MKFIIVSLILVSNFFVVSSKVSNISFYLNPLRLDDGVKELYRILRPAIEAKDISLFNFREGISNAMVRVDDPTTRNPIVVRVFGGKIIKKENETVAILGMHDRKLELATFEKASEMNITVQLIATFDNGLVMSYIEGGVIDVRKFDQKTAADLARRVAKFHTIKLDDLTRKTPVMNQIVGKEYPPYFPNETTIHLWDKEMKHRSDLNHLPSYSELQNKIKQLDKFFSAKNVYGEIRFCHNDLSLTNVIIEKATKTPYLIDFDLANTNYRNYEFGSFFVRLGGKFAQYWRFSDIPDDEFKKAFLRTYHLEYYKLTNVTMKEDEQFEKFLKNELDNIQATMLLVRLNQLGNHIRRAFEEQENFDLEKIRSYTQSMYANYLEVKDQVLRNIGINPDNLTSSATTDYLRNSIALYLICVAIFFHQSTLSA